MKTIDLHVHSTCSDGTDSPSRLAALGKAAGLSAMALTDHDTVSGIDEFLEACGKNGIEGVPGIEISCIYTEGSFEKEIHIVGLFIDHHSSQLNEALSNLVINRRRRNLQVVDLFATLGIDFSLEEIEEMYPGAILTRAHFADFLMKKGITGSINEGFDRFLGDGKPCYIKRETLSSSLAIDLIHNAGGMAILAHPLTYKLSYENLSNMVSRLAVQGIDGIEAIYSTFTSRDEADMKVLAQKNRLLISGGSDYHGKNKPAISLGTGKGRLEVPYEVLKNIKSLLKH